MNNNETFTADLPEEKYTFFIVAPITRSGIAFLGDAGKITATGKKRIATITDTANTLHVKVLFAEGEGPVTLQGYSEKTVTAVTLKVMQDAASHLFTIIVPPPVQGEMVNVKMQTK
ncbi:MAG: hypothetical protein ABIN89_16735 [Chitinophagaceae bacterium]